MVWQDLMYICSTVLSWNPPVTCLKIHCTSDNTGVQAIEVAGAKLWEYSISPHNICIVFVAKYDKVLQFYHFHIT